MRLTRVRIPIKLDEDELWLSGKPELLQFSLYHLLGDRPTVGLQILDLAILVRIQVSQPIFSNSQRPEGAGIPGKMGNFSLAPCRICVER